MPAPDPDNPAPRPRPPLPPPRTPAPRPRLDFAAEQEANRLLTRATIQFRRGLTADAEQAVQELLAQRPQDAGAHELLADIRLTRGDHRGAQDALRDALSAQPGRVSAEIKLAKIALQVAERARIQQMGMAGSISDLSRLNMGGVMPHGHAWSVAATIFLPGLGQYLSGDTVKGIVLAAIYFLGWTWLAAQPDMRSLVVQIARPGHSQPVGGLTWLLIAVLTVDWLYAIIDAARTSRRPAAPSDKDGWQV